jgi:hypothetical protein
MLPTHRRAHSAIHEASCLTTETVEGTSLALESIDNVEGCDSLALGVLGVCDGITDDTLKEGLKDTTGLLVNHSRDTLDTTTTSQTADSGLGDTLNVVTQNLAVTLGTTLSEALAALAACKEDASAMIQIEVVNSSDDVWSCFDCFCGSSSTQDATR